MPRAKRGNKRLQKRKGILKLARGYRGTKSKLYRHAKEQVERSLNFAFTGRKLADIKLDRKVLADLAVHEPSAFTEISGKVKEAIESHRAAAA